MKINIVEDEDGKSFVRDFLMSECNENDSGKIIQRLADLQEHTFETLTHHTKRIEKVEDELYAVRIAVNKVAYRFFGKIKNGVLHIGYVIKKKTNKLTKKDLRTARAKINRI